MKSKATRSKAQAAKARIERQFKALLREVLLFNGKGLVSLETRILQSPSRYDLNNRLQLLRGLNQIEMALHMYQRRRKHLRKWLKKSTSADLSAVAANGFLHTVTLIHGYNASIQNIDSARIGIQSLVCRDFSRLEKDTREPDLPEHLQVPNSPAQLQELLKLLKK